MFFTSKVNYKATPKIMAYAAVQTVYKLQQKTPPTVSDTNLVAYIKPI